ncbi:hypothetical protein BGZ63DRAFT_29507 [Mariannaea sp. PMI_226]|nr:hypothetical protein BGZ63DRAFT_29507 [Mariannaea sp. PMI_226]
MEQSRRAASRRRTFGDSASPPCTSEASSDLNSSTSPVATHINTTPQSAHNGFGRRATKPLQQRAFTFSPPGSSRSLMQMKRTIGTEVDTLIDEEDDGPKKGGHSLRKRARVDYTFEHIDDEVIVPNSTSSARGRKRKSEVIFDTEDMYSSEAKRRGASMGADTPSARRRNPSRKSSEMKAYREAVLEDDDNDVQDTIEVGVSYSDLDESEILDHTLSNPSSPLSTKSPSKTKPITAPSDIKPETRPIIKFRQSSVADFFAKASSKDSPVETPSRPAEQLQDTPTKVEPEGENITPLQQSTSTPGAINTSTPVPIIAVSDASLETPVLELGQASMGKLANGDIGLVDSESNLPPKEAAPANVESPQYSPRDTGGAVTNGMTEPNLSKEIMDDAPIDEPPKDSGSTEELEKAEKSEHGDSRSPVPETAMDVPSPSKSTGHDESTPPEQTQISTGIAHSDTPSLLVDAGQSLRSSEPRVVMDTTDELTNNEVPEPFPSEPKTPTPSTLIEPEIDFENPLPLNPEPESSPQKPASPEPVIEQPKSKKREMPNPAPSGRWAYLTPYIEGDYVTFPEKKSRFDEDAAADEPTPDREGLDMEPMVDDNEDSADMAPPEVPTPALNTPTRGSPVPDSSDPTAFNSPAPGGDDADDAEVAESQEAPEKGKIYQYRKLRDAEEFIAAIENYEEMGTEDLFNALEAIHISLRQWQSEWSGLGRIVDDYENSLRRRAADSKYEVRTRNLHQHGINYEEPDFAVKGYKAREREGITETRYLQQQDRIMAATYGFEYDPHPSKIGKQNPETQQSGIMTRGRSLRNQPRQTAKATETEEVVGKRQRKPVQLFDPTVQDVSRSSTPVPTRGRRKRNANADGDDITSNPATSFNTEVVSDGEAPKVRRRRGPRGKADLSNILEQALQDENRDEGIVTEEPVKPTRRGRGRPVVKYEEVDPNDDIEEESQPELKQPVRRHLLTLKIPKGKNFSEPTSAISDNGESRPSTASSEESSHTAESSYSFRPKRQKRFRDDPDGAEEATQAPPKKRGKRAKAMTTNTGASTSVAAGGITESPAAVPIAPASEPAQTPSSRKVQKIKVVRSEARNGPATEEGEEPQKDYKSMTKSEKMSASMKNRWANGNMAGAVEKRKATLAAKKAAQVAAEQKLGIIAPKPKGKAAAKKEAASQLQQQQQPPQMQPQRMQPLPPPPQHQMHLQQHPQQPIHPQHPPQYPLHQGNNAAYVHSLSNMGYTPYPPQM